METRITSVSSFVIVLFLLPSALGFAQDTPDEQAIRRLKEGHAGTVKETEKIRSNPRFAGDLKEVPACQHLFDGLTEAYEAKAREQSQQFNALAQQLDALLITVKPITDINAEVQRRKQQTAELDRQISKKTSEQTELQSKVAKLEEKRDDENKLLKEIGQSQRQAIRDWLLREYGQLQAKPSPPIKSGTGMIVNLNTLFGTLTAYAERELAPGEVALTTVTFTPAVFAAELFVDEIDLGPEGYTGSIPPGLEFEPATVSGSIADHKFALKGKEPVSPPTAIKWTWDTKALDEFKKADFEIQMNAVRKDARGAPQTVGHLPIKIVRKPTEPWSATFAKMGSWFGGAVALAVAQGLWAGSRRLREWWRERRARKIAERTLP